MRHVCHSSIILKEVLSFLCKCKHAQHADGQAAWDIAIDDYLHAFSMMRSRKTYSSLLTVKMHVSITGLQCACIRASTEILHTGFYKL